MSGGTARPARLAATGAGATAVVMGAIALARSLSSISDSGWARLVGLCSAVVVGLVLIVAGATKIGGRQFWAAQAANLGIPGPIAVLVPVVELTLGALSVVGVGWPVVPWGTVILLTSFTVFIATKLARGQRPSCACFGGWSAAPIAERDLWRNAGLIAMAILSLLR